MVLVELELKRSDPLLESANLGEDRHLGTARDLGPKVMSRWWLAAETNREGVVVRPPVGGMIPNDVFGRSVKGSPVSVMAKPYPENAPGPSAGDALLGEVTWGQHTRDPPSSDVVGLMAMVACETRPSIDAAGEEHAEGLGVTR